MRRLLKGHWLLILLLIPACAGTHKTGTQKADTHKAVMHTKVFYSRPEVMKASNDTFDINIKPIKVKKPYFVGFQLTVLNKTSIALSIDWDKTRYIHNGEDQGKFVSKGIDPGKVTAGIQKEAIAGGALLSKPIYPVKTLDTSQKGDVLEPAQRKIFPGILPNGINAALLAIVQGERQWRQAMTFELGTEESP